jgi:small GTP-binding protein
MPINASFEFERARIKYEQAIGNEAKLAALLEMQSTAPKHKGSEKLRAEISKKIANVRHEIEKQKEQQAKRGSGTSINVKKEGCGQIVLMGLPNSGKSSLLKALTGVQVEIAPYEFTTTKPEIGMMEFKGAKVQIVEVPAIVEGSSEGKANGTQLLSLARNSDAVVLVLDSEKAESELPILKSELLKAKVRLNEKKPEIRIEQSEYKGLSVSGKQFLKMPIDKLEQFLKSLGLHKTSVVLNEELKSFDKILQVLDEGIVYKPALALLNKKRNDAIVKQVKFDSIVFFGSNIEEIKARLFSLIEKVIVYTKKPGQEPDYNEPLVLKKGTTVEEVAGMLHKDFAKNLKHVKVWGSTRFEGQRVSKNYALQDFDIIEIYS